MRSWRSIRVALLGLVFLGCADLEVRPPLDDVVTAEFDPSATPPRVPMPTDLARDPTTGRITLPLPADAPLAARDLADYLAGLDAWPPAIPARATFDGAVDADSVLGGTVVFDVTAGAVLDGVAVELDAGGQRLTLIPPGGVWPAGHVIAVAVLGGEDGVRGAAGEPVIASPAMFFARSERPLTEVTVLAPEQRAALEPLRLAMAPLFDALEALGHPREEVALLWSFTISERAFAVFDPTSGRVPFPNDLLRDPASGRVALPIAHDDPPAIAAFKEQINTLEGFSTLAPAFAQVDLPPGVGLEPPGPGAVATSIPEPFVSAAGGTLAIRPGRPLDERSPYLVALTSALRDDRGRTVEAPLFMALLRSRGSLVLDGRSTVPVLDDEQAARLEPLRRVLVGALEQGGIPPEQVSLAWAFTTQPTVSVLQERIGGSSLGALPALASTGAEIPMPPNVPATGIASLRAGTLTGSAGGPVPYLLLLPAGTPRGAVIFQHGLGADKTAVFAIAGPFTQAGFAVASIDLPLHGDRAQEGRQFIDLADLLGTRDRILEGAADLFQLASGLREGLGGIIVPGSPAFVGVSLGGIVGTDFAAVADSGAPVVLSTTGGSLVNLALTSPTLGPDFSASLTAAGIPEDPAARALPLALAQTLLDAGDPLNYAGLLRDQPVLVQNAADDVVILPGFGTRLGELAGAQIVTYAGSGHAVLINPADPNFMKAVGDALGFVLGAFGGTP